MSFVCCHDAAVRRFLVLLDIGMGEDIQSVFLHIVSQQSGCGSVGIHLCGSFVYKGITGYFHVILFSDLFFLEQTDR